MKHRLYITFIAACLLCGQLCLAQPMSVMRHYDAKSGLSDNTVRTILQDAAGHIWFGTKDGINRFNGVHITRFGSYPRTADNPLLNTLKLCPHSTDENKIWVAAVDGLYLFDQTSGEFTFLDIKAEDSVGLKTLVADVCYDALGGLWIATVNGLFYYNELLGCLRHYTHEEGQPSSLPSNAVSCILRDSSGDMWFGTRMGLARYRRGVDKFDNYYLEHKRSDSTPFEVTAIVESSDGELWLGTRYDGLLHLNQTTGKFHSYPVVGSSKDNTWIRTLHERNNNTLLVGTEDGLFIFDYRTKTIQHQKSLGGESVYSLMADREGGLWIGTYFNGVYYLSPQSNNMRWYYDDGAEGSLTGNAVSQFCEDEKGNVWVATENGGLNYLDRRTGEFAHYGATNANHAVSHNNIHALMLDEHRLWIGTFSKGVDIMDTRTRRIVKNYHHSQDDTNSLPNNYVYCIYQTRNGDIYVGTMAGFCKYQPKRDNFHRFEQLRDIFVYDMVEDNEGRLWLASKDNGVWCYHHGEFKNYLNVPNDHTSLGNNHVIRAHLDKSGKVWFATEGGGICCYNADTDSFTNYDHRRNLYHHIIYGILDDDEGNLWLSSNYGIVRYNPTTFEQVVYTHEDGLQSNQFNYRSSMRGSDGMLYFGGVNGFNCFHPDRFHRNEVKPTANISGIVLHKPSSAYEISRIKARDKVVIGPQTASFEISYECLSFVSPSKNKYAYKVNKLHEDWVLTDKPSVTFMDMPAGDYRFLVRVANNDGVWSDNECFVDLTIQAPFWRTTTAKILYSLVAVVICALLLRRYLVWQKNKRERENKEMEGAMQQEIYRSKIEFFTHVAHEIKTPLTLIKAPLEAVLEEGKWGEDTQENLMVMQQNTDRLMELIKQLLSFRKIDNEGYQLSYSRVDINDFVRRIVKRFDSSKKSIHITANLPKESLVWMVDSEALTKIVSNLLANGLKYADSRIEVQATNVVVEGKNMLELTVSDDGPGITETEKAKIFEPFYRSATTSSENGFGIGLSLVKLLVDKHEGVITAGRSEALGGLMVTICLPQGVVLSNNTNVVAESEKNEEPMVDISGHECNLLIVEDTEEMLEFLMKNLGYHFNVFGAKNGRKALEVLEQQAIDLIVSDIVMPEMDGFELLGAVRGDKMLCHIPVVLLSAQGTVNSKITGLDYGADAYIEKPFSLNHIRATIDNLLKNRKVLFDRFASMPSLEYGKGELKRHDSEWLEQVNNIITRNFTNEKFSVDMLAAEMALSRSNLRRKLKGVTGLAPIDYIRLVRLKSAATLLKEGKHRVNEVCYMVGFQNHSYFARCFQKQFGVLPKDYMKE